MAHNGYDEGTTACLVNGPTYAGELNHRQLRARPLAVSHLNPLLPIHGFVQMDSLSSSSDSLLTVKGLKTWFYTDDGILKAVDGVDFTVPARSTLGLIGESGCGKSVTARSILRIVPRPGRIEAGEIHFQAREQGLVDLATLDATGPEIRAIRGREITMIFQEPMTSLSPVHSIGNQISETIRLHMSVDKREALERSHELLDRVGIPDPGQRLNEFPHHLSGGMRQRVMIAMALSCEPSLLIADEPTTALDVTVQAQILELMKALQAEHQMSVLFITHDLGVIAETCDLVAVMYLGRIVEAGPVREIFHNPQHPYTIRLMESIPRMGTETARLNTIAGTVPIPLDPPHICSFLDRCPERMDGICDEAMPALTPVQEQHTVRCFLHSRTVEPA